MVKRSSTATFLVGSVKFALDWQHSRGVTQQKKKMEKSAIVKWSSFLCIGLPVKLSSLLFSNNADKRTGELILHQVQMKKRTTQTSRCLYVAKTNKTCYAGTDLFSVGFFPRLVDRFQNFDLNEELRSLRENVTTLLTFQEESFQRIDEEVKHIESTHQRCSG